MRESDAFESAYGRLAATRLSAGVVGAEPTRGPQAAPAAVRATPRSRLLPRLALLAPRTPGPRLRDG